MATLTRYLVFKVPPKALYTTEQLAEEAAVEFARNDLGKTWQVWRVDGTRISRVTSDIETEIVPG